MKVKIINTLNRIIGLKGYKFLIKLRLLQKLYENYWTDVSLYKKYSSVFEKNSFEKKESEITLRYHSLEKGFLHNPIRPRFAIQRVKDLLTMLSDEQILNHIERAQIQSAIANLCNYYDLHKKTSIDISDFFTKSDYETLRNLLIKPLSSVKQHNKTDFFSKVDANFVEFSNSRCSVRSFTGEKISLEIIQNAINLANNAPSVCNRQPTKVILVENKTLIDKILEIQSGVTGYSEKVNQLIVLTCNRNYFYTIGERNQLYVDGGIYLMNLLYALHYFKIGSCPAHWGMSTEVDRQLREMLNLSDASQIICLVVIGVPTDEFKSTLSLKKTYIENLDVIN